MRSCNARTGRPLFNGVLFVLLAAGILPAGAQTVEQKKETEKAETISRRLPAPDELNNETHTLEDENGELVRLSLFSVTAEDSEGYRAKRTLAGTRLATNLDDIASSLQVVTKQFMLDTGATDVQSLLTKTVSTEVGGPRGNFSGLGAGRTLSATVLRPDLNTRVRGLTAADNARDYETSYLPIDAYNIESAEIQRGPNAILFGQGSAGGLINASTSQAGFRNHGNVAVTFGEHGSVRGTLDLNRVLIPDQLAVRLDVLDEVDQFQQRPAFSKDKRVFGALRFDPKFLNKGSAHTTFRANYETGRLKNNYPAGIPPYDSITPWFQTGTVTVNGQVYNNANKFTTNRRIAGINSADPGAGIINRQSPNYVPGIVSAGPENIGFFPDPSSPNQSLPYYFTASAFFSGQQFGLGPNGEIDQRIEGLDAGGRTVIGGYYDFAVATDMPYATDTKHKSLTDPSVFDFYNNLMFGPTQAQNIGFDAFNLVLNQTFLKNRIGVEAKYYNEHYNYWNFSPGWTNVIYVDVDQWLPDGSPNPNLGRPYIESSSSTGGSTGTAERESTRVTAYVDLSGNDIFKDNSWLSRVFSRNVVTGAWNESNRGGEDLVFNPYAIARDQYGVLNSDIYYRRLGMVSYIGPSLLNASSASGANLSRINANQAPYAPTLLGFDSHWNKPTTPGAAGYVDPAATWINPITNVTSTESENPANYVGWRHLTLATLSATNGDLSQLTTNATKTYETTESKVLVWQSFFFDGALVGTLGYREDESRAYRSVAPVSQGGGQGTATSILNSPDYVLPDVPYNTVEGSSKSYSLVGRLPAAWQRHLPWDSNVGFFFNGSENFRPDSARVDLYNEALPKPTGKTKEFGVFVELFGGKFHVKATHFDTRATNESQGVVNSWLGGVALSRAWGMAKRYEAGLTGAPEYAGPAYNFGHVDETGTFVTSPEERAQQQAAVTAMLSNIDERIVKGWELELDEDLWKNGTGLFFKGVIPPAVGLRDVKSTGYELELYFRPTNNWNIYINGSQTAAVQSNLLGNTIKDFIEKQSEIYAGPAGDIRLYNGLAVDTIRIQWETAVLQPYKLTQLLDGSLSSEISKYRFSVTSTYSFSEGLIKGMRVGGGYSWASKVAIGYPSITKNVLGVDSNTYDIEHPFYGPSDQNLNLWIGYGRLLKHGRVWDIQLNINNAFGKNELIPINAQPDGGPATYRIKYGMGWTLRTSVSF